MQKIKNNKRKINIQDVSNALLATTIIASILLLLLYFVMTPQYVDWGMPQYIGWGVIYIGIFGYFAFHVLFVLFWFLLVYNAMYKWLLNEWSTPSLLAQAIIVIVYIILDDTK